MTINPFRPDLPTYMRQHRLKYDFEVQWQPESFFCCENLIVLSDADTPPLVPDTPSLGEDGQPGTYLPYDLKSQECPTCGEWYHPTLFVVTDTSVWSDPIG